MVDAGLPPSTDNLALGSNLANGWCWEAPAQAAGAGKHREERRAPEAPMGATGARSTDGSDMSRGVDPEMMKLTNELLLFMN